MLSWSSSIILQFQGENQWAQEFQGEHDWGNEFDQLQRAGGAQAQANASSQQEAMQQTKALAETLAASNDPKFKNSKFLQFVSKMSRGEIILEDNQVTPSYWAWPSEAVLHIM